jgi:adrenodoxin-NADP+ reductase
MINILKHFWGNFHITRYLTSSACLSGPKVAVVGGGSAGFYATQQIAKARTDVQIDIYEKLPVPFGLVRFGVSPDHQDVKKCISTFNKVADLPNVSFIGNSTLGKDFSFNDLMSCYDSVLLTYWTDEDRKLGIPGEHLNNVIGARDLVSVYNGLPGYENFDVNLDTETVVIVGVGNVSIDVARLILTPVDVLKKFDVTDSWLENLATSKVKRVVLVGRRGPLHVSFTIKEFREMIKLQDTKIILHKDQYLTIKDEVAKLQRPRKRLIELLVNSDLKPDVKLLKDRLQPAKLGNCSCLEVQWKLFQVLMANL